MADRLASDEPRRLADFLRENREQILAHCEAEVRKVRAALQLERPLLLDHVPEAHGGSISVRSTAAEGTTFTVRWP